MMVKLIIYYEEECPICKDKLTPETIYTRLCGHVLCYNCSTNMSDSCHICRNNEVTYV